MNRASLRRQLRCLPLKTGGVALLLFGLLFGGSSQSASGFLGSALREINAVLRDAETQWMVFLCLAIYFMAFLFLRSRLEISSTQRLKGAESGAHESTRSSLCLAGALGVGAINYATHYSPSLPALTLIAGAVVGQGMAVWARLESRKQKAEIRDPGSERRICFSTLVMVLFVTLLSFAAVWNNEVGHSYEYRRQARWTGPWDNPNIFGLLMGAGVALAIGGAIAFFGSSRGNEALNRKVKSGNLPICRLTPPVSPPVGSPHFSIHVWFLAGLFLVAAGLMARGLLHSYSRGAWLATSCGLAFLIGSWFWRMGDGGRQIVHPSTVSHQLSTRSRWFQNNWLSLVVIFVAIGAICFWHFRQTDLHPARRALSMVNSADFSSRNRVAAWIGDLQMMAEHPWFGTGWNQPEPLYEHYYLSPRLIESAAIQMNDYLMLGATLGIPAIFCFAMYLWLSLTRKAESRSWKSEIAEVAWLQTTCRAGAIVLLVGFWFDGGLFKLPTAATFWILLELGNGENREESKLREND